MKPEFNQTSIDARLAAEDQQRVRLTVKALPDEVPSLAWRSQLNERIYAEANKRRSRQRLWWIFTPSIGVAVAGALAVAVMFKAPAHVPHAYPSAVVSTNATLEDSLVNIASDGAISDDVTGSGLHPRDLNADATTPSTGSTDDSDAGGSSDL